VSVTSSQSQSASFSRTQLPSQTPSASQSQTQSITASVSSSQKPTPSLTQSPTATSFPRRAVFDNTDTQLLPAVTAASGAFDLLSQNDNLVRGVSFRFSEADESCGEGLCPSALPKLCTPSPLRRPWPIPPPLAHAAFAQCKWNRRTTIDGSGAAICRKPGQ